eukprot:318027-Prymnesium_polylepis.1
MRGVPRVPGGVRRRGARAAVRIVRGPPAPHGKRGGLGTARGGRGSGGRGDRGAAHGREGGVGDGGADLNRIVKAPQKCFLVTARKGLLRGK